MLMWWNILCFTAVIEERRKMCVLAVVSTLTLTFLWIKQALIYLSFEIELELVGDCVPYGLPFDGM